MKKCNKCGSVISDNDKMAWKCTECGKAFSVNLSKLKKLYVLKNKPENTGKMLLKCSACGNGIDNGDEKIACKCSTCGNVMIGKLRDFAGEDNKPNTTIDKIHSDKTNFTTVSKCYHCGCNLSSDSKFCPECGSQISGIQNQHRKKSYKKAILLTAFLFIIILIGSFSTVVIKNYKVRSYAIQLQTLYDKAKTYIEKGQYKDAKEILTSIYTYKDTAQLLEEIKYESIAFYCIQDIANAISNFSSFSVKKISFYSKEYRYNYSDDQRKKFEKYYNNLDDKMPLILIEYRNNNKDYYAAYIYKQSNNTYNFYGLANTLNMEISSIKEALALLANTNESDARGMFNMAYSALIPEGNLDISKVNRIITDGLAGVNAVQILDIDAI